MSIKLLLTGETTIIELGDSKNYIVYTPQTDSFNLESEFNNLEFSEHINLHEYEGLFTIIRQIDCLFLVVIDSKSLVLQFLEHKIYQIKSLKIFNLTGKLSTTLTAFNFIQNSFTEFVKDNQIYYSPTLDLTKSQQFSSTFPNSPSIKKFSWNLTQIPSSIPDFLLSHFPSTISGFISSTNLAGSILTIIARRSVYNSGPRLLHRAIDKKGFSANFVEVESILKVPTTKEGDLEETFKLYSFIQTRGCVPVSWIQSPNVFNKPTLTAANFPKCLFHPKLQTKLNSETLNAFKTHFNNLQETYGKVTIINLLTVSPSSTEHNLTKEYEHFHKLSNLDVRYFSLDFHSVMKLSGFDLAILEKIKFGGDSLNCLVRNQGHFLLTKKFSETGEILQKTENTQKGVFRVNCADSTDRTLVMNYKVGREFVKHTFMNSSNPLNWDEEIENKVSAIWANTGNSLSEQYTKTKTHMSFLITYPGHRSVLRLLTILIATMRMFYDCFTAGYREDKLGLALGRNEIKRTEAEAYSNKVGNEIWALFGRLVAVMVICLGIVWGVDIVYDVGKWLRGILVVLSAVYIGRNLVMLKQNRVINRPTFDRSVGRIK